MSAIPDDSQHEQKPSRSLFDLGRIGGFWRRRWKQMAAAALLVFGLSLAAFMSQPPKYTAAAVMIIKPRALRIELNRENHASLGVIAESQLDVLRSPMMIGRLVDALALHNDPEWNPNLSSGRPELFPLVRPPKTQNAPPRMGRSGDGVRETVVKQVTAAISVRRAALSNFIEVSATSANPRRAAQMANRLVELYIGYWHAQRLSEEAMLRSWRARQMQQLTDEAARKRASLEQYRAQTNQPSRQVSRDSIDRRLAEFEREAKAAADVLDEFREHTSLLVIQGHGRDIAASMVSRATAPARPSSPKLAMAFLLSLGLGLALGLVVGLLAELSPHNRIARLDPVSA